MGRRRDAVHVRVDDAISGRPTAGFPAHPAHIVASAWWPVWPACAPLAEPADHIVDSRDAVPQAAAGGA